TVDGSSLTIERQTDEGYEVVTAQAPAVVSVWDTINEPRYPSFKGIMEAKKKPVRTLSLADLGIPADEVGFDGASSVVVEHRKRPPRQAGNKVTDSGDGGVKLVEFLASEKFVGGAGHDRRGAGRRRGRQEGHAGAAHARAGPRHAVR